MYLSETVRLLFPHWLLPCRYSHLISSSCIDLLIAWDLFGDWSLHTYNHRGSRHFLALTHFGCWNITHVTLFRSWLSSCYTFRLGPWPLHPVLLGLLPFQDLVLSNLLPHFLSHLCDKISRCAKWGESDTKEKQKSKVYWHYQSNECKTDIYDTIR